MGFFVIRAPKAGLDPRKAGDHLVATGPSGRICSSGDDVGGSETVLDEFGDDCFAAIKFTMAKRNLHPSLCAGNR